MSYCVNCGVELGAGAGKCPLCGTAVVNPACPPDSAAEPFFPTRREEVAPVSRREAGLLLSAMFASVTVCCAVLNLIFYRELCGPFSPGARPSCSGSGSPCRCSALAQPVVPPDAGHAGHRRVCPAYRLRRTRALLVFQDRPADIPLCHGCVPHRDLAAPLPPPVHTHVDNPRAAHRGRAHGVVELVCDLYISGAWRPGWSLIVLISCAGLCIPLIVIRRVPSLREEARRRFHL